MNSTAHIHASPAFRLAAGIAALLVVGTVVAGPNCEKNPNHHSCPGGGGGGSDTEPPADVGPIAVDSTTNTITLQFVAPGDDGMSGVADAYDIRISSTGPIDDTNFASAERDVWSERYVPRAAGTTEYWTIRERTPGTTYYVAVKALDEAVNASAIQSATVETASEDPPFDVNWSVSTIVKEPDGIDGQVCCSSPGLAVHDDGQVSVSYKLGRDGARYARRDGDGTWTPEHIGGPTFPNDTLAGEFDDNALWGLTLGLNPDPDPAFDGPEVFAWGRNHAVVTDPKGRNTSREAIIFAARMPDGTWSREVVNDGGFGPGGAGDGGATSLVYDPDVSGALVPTTAYVTWPLYGKRTKTNALTIARRTPDGVWEEENLFECPHTIENPYLTMISAAIRLHVDTFGRLHFQASVADGVIGGYEDDVDGWQYYWTGPLPVGDTGLTTDGLGKPIIVFPMDPDGNGSNLYLLDGGAQTLQPITVADACNPPSSATASYEPIDSYGGDDHDDGNMVDFNRYVRVDGLLRDDNGLYVSTRKNGEAGHPTELRILALCNNHTTWLRDPTDRTRARGQAVLTPTGMASVYYLGRSGGSTYDWYEDVMLFAERDGTPCDPGSL